MIYYINNIYNGQGEVKRKQNPEKTISMLKLRPFACALQDSQLLSQRKVLHRKVGCDAEFGNDRQENLKWSFYHGCRYWQVSEKLSTITDKVAFLRELGPGFRILFDPLYGIFYFIGKL
jgi:hypothetical protein